jgi:hypothetical protein
MSSDLCAATACSLIAWATCEHCQRPFCFTHGRLEPHEVVHGRSVVIVFAFVCYDCQADVTAEAGWATWESEMGDAG